MREYRYHDGWNYAGHLLFGWLIPLVIIAGLVVLAVWAIRRMTPVPSSAVAAPTAGTPHTDPAVESARIRYAGGDLSREEYLRVVADLGAPVADPPVPSGSSEI
jgi:uncharacterized membrane protein